MNKTSDSLSNYQQHELVSITPPESLLQPSLSQAVLGQTCIDCDCWKPYVNDDGTKNFYPRFDQPGKYYGRCVPCYIINVQVRRYGNDYLNKPRPDYCECCLEPSAPEDLSFDHDHETGNFRGWLCTNCNTGIGKLGDSIKGIENALRYLRGVYEITD